MRTDQALCEFLGARLNDPVGFLQRVDNLKLAAYRVRADREHASQTRDVRLRSHDHLPSWVAAKRADPHRDCWRAVATKTPDHGGGGAYRRILRRGKVKDGRVRAALRRDLEVPVHLFGQLHRHGLPHYGEANNRMRAT